MSAGKYRIDKDCLNCGHHVEEHFCTHCGQENIEIKEDAIHLITHAVADYFHFESKFLGTMKPLLLQPGWLSKLYVAGKRVAFIHPIKVYIFISIVFFLFMLSSKKSEQAELESTKSGRSSKLKIERLESDLKNPAFSQSQRDSLVRTAVAEVTQSERTQRTIDSKLLTEGDSTLAAYENRQQALSKNKRDNFLKHYIVRKNFELRKYPDVSEKIEQDIKHNVPKMMFILLPLFALLLKLVYFRSKKFYYEHLIYSFHVHAALFLSLLVVNALSWIFDLFYDISVLLTFAWLGYAFWYIYRSLRTFYGSKKWVTVAKFMFLMFGYLMVFSISSILVIAVTMIML